MTKLNITELKHKGKQPMAESVSEHRSQWWATLTFETRVTLEVAKDRLLGFTRKLCRGEKIQVGYVAVFSEETRPRTGRTGCRKAARLSSGVGADEKPRPHWHLLMVGKDRWGRTLHNISSERWAKEWCRVNCGASIAWNDGARIVPVYEPLGVSEYLIENWNPRRSESSDVVVYGQRVLAKYREHDQPAAAAERPMKRETYRVRRGEDAYQRLKQRMIGLIMSLQSQKNTNHFTEVENDI